MMLSAMLRAKAQRGSHPAGRDVVLAIVCDEEAGGDYGAKFLVSHHGELLRRHPLRDRRGGRLYPATLAGSAFTP